VRRRSWGDSKFSPDGKGVNPCKRIRSTVQTRKNGDGLVSTSFEQLGETIVISCQKGWGHALAALDREKKSRRRKIVKRMTRVMKKSNCALPWFSEGKGRRSFCIGSRWVVQHGDRNKGEKEDEGKLKS